MHRDRVLRTQEGCGEGPTEVAEPDEAEPRLLITRAHDATSGGRGTMQSHAIAGPGAASHTLESMRAVVFTGAGGNEVIRLDERPEPTPSGDDVLVAVRYAALNPADLAQREGRYPAPPGSPPDVPGIEVAGTVIAVGPTARRFTPGERVFGIVGGGGLAERVLVHELHVTACRSGWTSSAAAVPEVFVTAHDAVMTQAGLRPGELLLVNGANGGVGTAAVQIAAVSGARVLGTVCTAAVRDRVATLGATVIDPTELVERARADEGCRRRPRARRCPEPRARPGAIALKGRIVRSSAPAPVPRRCSISTR